MPRKDEKSYNKYMRNYMRRQRSAAKVAELLGEGKEAEAEAERQRLEVEESKQEFKMQEAEDLRVMVEDAIRELKEEEGLDPVIKARAIFQGASVAIKLLELTDMAKRLEALEGKDKADSEQ